MPLSATETECRILQLDNDVSEIYTMIADIQNTQRRHTHRFSEMGLRIDSLVDRQTGVEGRLEGVEGRLGAVEGRLEGVEGQLGAVEGRLEGVEGQLGGVEGRLEQLGGQMGEVLTLLRDRG